MQLYHFLLSLILITATLSSCSTQPTEPQSPSLGERHVNLEDLKHKDYLLTLYIALLDQGNWEEMIRFTDPGPKSTEEGIQWVHQVNTIVHELDCPGMTPDSKLAKNLYYHLLPQLWMLNIQDQLSPTAEEIENYYKKNHEDYRSARWVKGIKIFIPNSSQRESLIQSWQKRLEQSNRPFKELAQLYLKETKSDSSITFQVKEGLARPEVFTMFWEAPLNQWQGPSTGRTGTLFYEINSRGTFEKKKQEQINQEITRSLKNQAYHSYLEYRRERFRQEHEIKMIFNSEGAALPTMNNVAYILDGTSYTFTQIKEALPNVMGDTKNKKYYISLVKMGLDFEMIRQSQEAETVLSSPEYLFLMQSILNQKRLQMKQKEMYSSITFTEDDLLKWYEDNKMSLYTQLENPNQAMKYSKAQRNVLRDFQWAEKGKIREQLNLPY